MYSVQLCFDHDKILGSMTVLGEMGAKQSRAPSKLSYVVSLLEASNEKGQSENTYQGCLA